MYNAKYIIPGVLIAVVAFTSPFWLNLGGKTYVYPEVDDISISGNSSLIFSMI